MSHPALSKVRKTAASLRQQVLEGLRDAIVSGQMPAGKRLTERELIDTMGVSRTVIREALRQLEAEHLIEVIPNKGPVVRGLTREEAKDLYRIRAALYGLAARIFVEQTDMSGIGNLEAALTAVVTAYDSGDSEAVVAAKTTFYDVLLDGTRSDTLQTMLTTLHARIQLWRSLGLRHPRRSDERSSESIANLREIVAAAKRNDADAAEAVSRQEANQAAREVMRILDEEAEEDEEEQVGTA